MVERERLLAALRAKLDRAVAMQDRSLLLGPDTFDEARQLAAMLRDDDDDLQVRLMLGWLHVDRFVALPDGEERPDVEAAIAMFTPCFIAEVADLPEEMLPLLAEEAVPTAIALLREARDSHDDGQISRVAGLWQRIVSAIPADDPDYPDRGLHLAHLSGALHLRFSCTGAMADLDEAIEVGQAALETIPPGHEFRGSMLSGLASTLNSRAQRTGTQADADAAIGAWRAAAEGTPPGHPDYAEVCTNLGHGLHARFQSTGSSADLDAAVDAWRAARGAVAADGPEAAKVAFSLGFALQQRFERTGSLSDLDAAVEAARAAVSATSRDDPSWRARLGSLGATLWDRFRRAGAMSDLNAAVDVWLDVLEATPARHRDRMELSNNLGVALHTRFIRTGALADLDAAIAAVREALETATDDDPGRATTLNSLGIVLQTRFDRIGALPDIDAAVEAQRAAVEIALAGEDSRSALTNLASALCSRYRRTGQLTDLNDAIDAAREAAETTLVGHPSWAGRHANLATALRDRFERTRSRADLDAAAEAAQAAVDATPVGHPERGGFLSNLGIILHSRFEHTGTDADLDAAVSAGQAAVNAAPADHPGRAVLLSNLGFSLQERFERAHQMADRQAAASAFAAASKCTSAPPSQRILGARSAAALLTESDRGMAADLLEAAVGLLGEVTPRQLRRPDQQHVLGALSGLASDAAALSLADTDAGTTHQARAARALRLLEAGRAVLLSQALGTRDGLTDLRQQHPQLAEEFTTVRDQLDQPQDNAAPSIPIADGTTPLAVLAQAEDNRGRLATQLAAVQAEIRALESFTTFGLPPSSEELLAQAVSGPIVSFNVSAYRSDALLLTTSGITSVELPGLAQAILIERINAFHQAIHEAPDAAAEQVLAETLAWLWDNAAEPVLEALGYRSQPPPGMVRPRVWWAPGGLLGLLPIHAAGHHTEAMAGCPAPRTVMDRVVSSYTPTIRALRYVRRSAHRDSAHSRALVVAMPTTPGIDDGAPLPSVADETAKIQAYLPSTVVLAEPDTSVGGTSALPTRENVFAQLPACSIAHFACHGVSDSADPSKSRLLLHDHRTAPLTVASLAAVQHDQLQLVYLSACRTAFNATTELLDEAIHLTSAFQLAGSRHVIGTLWEISDAIAVHMADEFYGNLRASTATLHIDQAAYALHYAVRALRERYPTHPSLWAAHLHAGA